MNQITEILLGVFACTGFWTFLQNYLNNRNKRNTAEQKLLLGIAYKVILDLCHQHIADGEIDADDYKELSHYLFEPYEELGGNGTAKRLVNEVDKLPIAKENKYE